MSRLRKNDKVKVISGNNKGKEGKILKIYRAKDRSIVKGVNIIKRHTRPNQKNPQGVITQKEAPIHVSNVMLIDPKAGEPTRLGVKESEEEGSKKKRMRYVVKSGEIIVS